MGGVPSPPMPKTLEEAIEIIRLLVVRISELEAKLGKNSSNSSQPPSSDPPGTPPPSRPKVSGRKRGGQPGHDKHERSLIPVEQVDRVFVLKPPRCRNCCKALSGSDPEPYRHQVFEV